MIRLALLGATGRMGRRVISLLEDDHRFEIVAALTNRDDSAFGETVRCQERSVTVSDTCEASFDILLDFSIPAGTMAWLDLCVSNKVAMVIGATGHSEQHLERIRSAANKIALLRASNFSVGVNLMLKVVADVAKRLGDAYDIEIIEHHHARKIDAPSGTAVALADAILESTDRDKSEDVVYGRHGETGMRPQRQIGVHAIRMGETVGHHEVHYSGPGETITVRHTAHSRDTFARGAIEAAAWIHNKPAGLYAMADVLGLAT